MPNNTPAALDKQVGGTHYKDQPIQHVEYCQRNQIPWCESAAIKYIVRHKKKNGKQDILKAIHYLELLLQLEYPEPAEQQLELPLEESNTVIEQ